MLSKSEIQLVNRCAGYVHELADIYSFGGTNNHHILADLKRIEGLLNPSAHSALRWVDDVVEALMQLGGKAHLSRIENRVRELRFEAGRSWPKNAGACVRHTLETHCANSLNYRGGPNLFEMVDRGSGWWRLRVEKSRRTPNRTAKLPNREFATQNPPPFSKRRSLGPAAPISVGLTRGTSATISES
jgi:hypothetical protein